MHCKFCGCVEFVKNGIVRGFQRYRCQECRRNWTEKPSPYYPQEIKLQALQLYLEGLGFRSIGRFLQISNTTVLYWIRQFSQQFQSESGVFKVSDLKTVPYIQIDELWHWAQKKRAKFGFGWLYAPETGAFLPFFVGKGTKKRPGNSGLSWNLFVPKEFLPMNSRPIKALSRGVNTSHLSALPKLWKRLMARSAISWPDSDAKQNVHQSQKLWWKPVSSFLWTNLSSFSNTCFWAHPFLSGAQPERFKERERGAPRAFICLLLLPSKSWRYVQGDAWFVS